MLHKIDFNHCYPHIPNIDVISGVLITLSLSKFILNSQCEGGARDRIDIWYMGIIPYIFDLSGANIFFS